MTNYPSFFRADEEIEPSEKGTPSPNEWFGHDRTKFASGPGPAFSENEDEDNYYDGWREFFQGPRPPHPRDPMKNKWFDEDSSENSLKFKDEQGDPRRLIFVLEQAAEIFETEGHIDLAAECERLCEQVSSED